MTDNATPAGLMLTLFGKTLFIVGTALTSIGFTYGIHKVAGYGVFMIEVLPVLVGDRHKIEEEELFSAKKVAPEMIRLVKILSILGAGVLCKYIGNYFLSPEFIELIEQKIYRSKSLI